MASRQAVGAAEIFGLDPIEKAIRNAFAKGEPGDPAFREKVYRSAFNALDRTLEANPGITVEKAIARRKRLQAQITAIEQEFVPPPVAVERFPAADMPPTSPDAGRAGPGRGRRVEPSLGDDVDAEGRFGASPRLAGDPAEIEPDPDMRRARKPRRGWAVFFAIAMLLALIGIGAWWAYQTGLFLSAEQRDTSVPNPPVELSPEDFSPEAPPEGQASAPPPLGATPVADRDWINIFSAADLSAVTAPSGASADVLQADGETFLRVRSGNADTAVMFDVGEGVLQGLAGRTAVFNIVARVEGEGQETEIAVECDFGELGDCGRKRYAVGLTRAEHLFEMEFPQGPPGAGGTIALTSDVSGSGRSVDIFEIKVAAAE
ncbi:MAG TPA: hypothetical protein VGN97_12965 [Mesorhizobium sp.]|jgi:hypothetical protein|nr:hypothetical protein [Mesorhizobium sp.]